MKILLIRPRSPKETIGLQSVMICEPLELEYLVANLKPLGDEVEILDMILEKKPIENYIKSYKPDVVGITGYISHVNIIKKYAGEIKSISKDIKIVVGGVHAEVVPEDFVSDFIDYIVEANGISTFINIINSLKKGEEEKVPGTYGGPKVIKEREFNWLHPDRNSVKKYRHKYYYMFHNPCALIKTSYGCPYQCSFCFCRKITDGQYFVRELPDIIEELKAIVEEEVYIVDDDFLFNKERLIKFCQLLKASNIKKKFLVYGRADFIAENEDVIKELASCGLRACIVGLESSSEEELKKYNKKSHVGLNEKAVKILQKYQVECYGTLILGIDWGKEDFKNLYQWIKKLNIRFVNLQPFTPIPGTELLNEYKDKLIVKREQHEKWDLAHVTVNPSKLSIKSYYFNIIKLYYQIIMRPSNVYYIIKNYGVWESIKLSLGSTNISIQYLLKALGIQK